VVTALVLRENGTAVQQQLNITTARAWLLTAAVTPLTPH